VSRKIALPTEEQVRQAMGELAAEASATGRRPTVLGLARRFGLANATFWRHFPDIANEVRHATRTREGTDPPGASHYEELKNKNAELRRANTDLTEHLALAVANIQRLTLDNHLLREALETTQKVTRLPSRPGIS
jgi:hypothetical protein